LYVFILTALLTSLVLSICPRLLKHLSPGAIFDFIFLLIAFLIFQGT
jgi:hypothetical protein